jgi:DNA-binding Lrp family transcriptional regulator
LFAHKIYFQLHSLTKEKKEKMIQDLKKNKKIIWIAECTGAFDLITTFLCKNIKEFADEKNEILKKYSRYIQNYYIGIMSDTHIYPRKYLINKQENEEIMFVGGLKPAKLDIKDKAILMLLSKESRIQTLEIAQRLKLNVKTIVSKIKNLEEQNIIQGYKISINNERIGYSYCKAFISISQMKSEYFKKFLEFCKTNKNIIYLVENVGSWELEPEFIVESEEEFYEVINKIKEEFSDFVKKIDIVKINKENKMIYSPEVLE